MRSASASRKSAYVVHVADAPGRIWSCPPCVQSDGLVSLLSRVPPKSAFLFVRFTVRGDQFALLDRRGTIFAFHVLQNRYTLLLRAGSCPVAAEFAPSPKSFLAVAFVDHTIRIVDVDTALVVATLKAHHSGISTLSWHPDGQYLSSTSRDRVVVWECRAWARRRTLDTHDVAQARFSSCGASIITCVRHDGLVAWDSAKFRMQYRLPPPARGSLSGAAALVTFFSCSSDGRYVLGSGASPHLLLWESQILALLRIAVLPVTVTAVVATSFLPDSDVAVVLGDDGTLLFYHVLSLKVLLTLSQAHRSITGFSIGSGGRYVACVCSDGTVAIYDLDKAFATEEAASMKQGDDRVRVLGSIPVYAPGDPTPLSEPTNETSTPAPAAASVGVPPARGKSTIGVGRDYSDDGIAKDRPSESSPNPVLQPEKLKALLRSQGEYPEKYRVLIWRFQLRLPENRSAYAALSSQAIHPAFADMDKRYPLQDRRLFRRLQRLCSSLAHWSPVFGEVEYLPALAFPFVRMFGTNEIVAFEAMATLLLNWCQRWFEFFPNAPVSLLQEMEALLRHHDDALLAHLASYSLELYEYLWPLLHTLLTEVLPANTWKILMDHILSNRVSLLPHVVVAWLRLQRRALLSLCTKADLTAFLRSQHATDAGELLRLAYGQRRTTPERLALKEPTWHGLPPGSSYPVFTAFPKFVVDFQLKERERIRAEESELRQKRISLAELEKETAEVLRVHDGWKAQQAALRKAEQERMRQWKVEEETRLRQRKALDRAAAERRTRQIMATNAALAAQIKARQEQRAAEIKRLEDEESHRRAKMKYELEARLEEEALLNVEFQLQAQAMAANEEQQYEEAVSQSESQAVAAAKKREAELQAANEKWKLEDEERRIRAKMMQEHKLKVERLNEEMKVRAAVEAEIDKGNAEHEATLARVMRERRLRHLAQDELERRQAYEAEEKKRLELLSKEEALARQEILKREAEFLKQVERERETILDAEKRRAGLEAEKRARRLEELDREQRRREFEGDVAQRHQDEVEKLVDEEKEMQAVLASVEEEARRGRQLEMEIRYRDERAQEQMAFASVMNDAKKSVVKEERVRYGKLMEEMKAKFRLEEEELERKHKMELDRIVGQREASFAGQSQEWRDQVRADEIERIKAEHAENRRRQAKLRQRHEAEADAMRMHITEALAKVSDAENYDHVPTGKDESKDDEVNAARKSTQHRASAADAGTDSLGESDNITKKAQELLKQHQQTLNQARGDCHLFQRNPPATHDK